MWNKIIHPKTGRKVNLNSKIGKQVLRNYVNQIGGAEQAGIEDEYADINEFGNINQALVQSIADDDIDNVIQILEYSRHNKVLEQQLLEIEQILTTDIVKKGRIVSEKKIHHHHKWQEGGREGRTKGGMKGRREGGNQRKRNAMLVDTETYETGKGMSELT